MAAEGVPTFMSGKSSLKFKSLSTDPSAVADTELIAEPFFGIEPHTLDSADDQDNGISTFTAFDKQDPEKQNVLSSELMKAAKIEALEQTNNIYDTAEDPNEPDHAPNAFFLSGFLSDKDSDGSDSDDILSLPKEQLKTPALSSTSNGAHMDAAQKPILSSVNKPIHKKITNISNPEGLVDASNFDEVVSGENIYLNKSIGLESSGSVGLSSTNRIDPLPIRFEEGEFLRADGIGPNSALLNNVVFLQGNSLNISSASFHGEVPVIRPKKIDKKVIEALHKESERLIRKSAVSIEPKVEKKSFSWLSKKLLEKQKGKSEPVSDVHDNFSQTQDFNNTLENTTDSPSKTQGMKSKQTADDLGDFSTNSLKYSISDKNTIFEIEVLDVIEPTESKTSSFKPYTKSQLLNSPNKKSNSNFLSPNQKLSKILENKPISVLDGSELENVNKNLKGYKGLKTLSNALLDVIMSQSSNSLNPKGDSEADISNSIASDTSKDIEPDQNSEEQDTNLHDAPVSVTRPKQLTMYGKYEKGSLDKGKNIAVKTSKYNLQDEKRNSENDYSDDEQNIEESYSDSESEFYSISNSMSRKSSLSLKSSLLINKGSIESNIEPSLPIENELDTLADNEEVVLDSQKEMSDSDGGDEGESKSLNIVSFRTKGLNKNKHTLLDSEDELEAESQNQLDSKPLFGHSNSMNTQDSLLLEPKNDITHETTELSLKPSVNMLSNPSSPTNSKKLGNTADTEVLSDNEGDLDIYPSMVKKYLPQETATEAGNEQRKRRIVRRAELIQKQPFGRSVSKPSRPNDLIEAEAELGSSDDEDNNKGVNLFNQRFKQFSWKEKATNQGGEVQDDEVDLFYEEMGSSDEEALLNNDPLLNDESESDADDENIIKEHLKYNVDQDSKQVGEIIRDLTTGRLGRRRNMGNGYLLDDDEDYNDRQTRTERMLARRGIRKKLENQEIKDMNLAKIAKNPNTAAFAQAAMLRNPEEEKEEGVNQDLDEVFGDWVIPIIANPNALELKMSFSNKNLNSKDSLKLMSRTTDTSRNGKSNDTSQKSQNVSGNDDDERTVILEDLFCDNGNGYGEGEELLNMMRDDEIEFAIESQLEGGLSRNNSSLSANFSQSASSVEISNMTQGSDILNSGVDISSRVRQLLNKRKSSDNNQSFIRHEENKRRALDV
ncbi:hypothetical protein BB560_000877 [Smittium megazygosporum]|uniref:DNA replication checkpoint mediator MRC1 domain-containing protein n=1 Tax=Smittium megazygosporum TaxID=133381 RepID=A0A2T9ZJ88_9FUNG|nr:hypothetical protein BB560_000877 [Smittium megazygosporum]